MQIHIHDSLQAIDNKAWNSLVRDDHPFLLYEFLYALESTGCLGKEHGWYPRYFTLLNSQGDLLAACPAYIKTNSYGEFVFDWSWAEAYESQHLAYYPKLVVAVPYTPATGQRLLVHPDQNYDALSSLLINAVTEYAKNQKFSGVHWLFTNDEDSKTLQANALQLRTGCQYHWKNKNYTSFDDFLSNCTSKRRKTIRRERRSVAEQGLTLETCSGDQLNPSQWQIVAKLYASTFERKWGEASLNQAFFETTGRTMGDRYVIIFVWHNNTIIACSVMFKSNNTLYGRYWGCSKQFKDLHFEACFYQGIEYCIKNNLNTFEPGAQGEHKITRGFRPSNTSSAHTLFHPGFNQAISGFLEQEKQLMFEQCEQLQKHLPFKENNH
jgi:predicted N-acyltransferase